MPPRKPWQHWPGNGTEAALQRSRDVAAAETSLLASTSRSSRTLQRSRDVAAAETCIRCPASANISPLQRSRDVAAAETLILELRPSPRSLLQRSRDVAAAETNEVLAKIAGTTGFNGAATLPPRKLVALVEIKPRTLASTEPRRCRRGNKACEALGACFPKLQRSRDVAAAETPDAGSRLRCRGRFNGAATLPPRKPPRRCARASAGGCFNGAATLPPRKRRFRRRSAR